MSDSETIGGSGMPLAEEFAMLARSLQSLGSEQATLQAVCNLARDLLDADEAAFTTSTTGRFRTVAATSDLPRQVDAIQYRVGEGPCVDVIGSDTTFRSDDLRIDPRWPRFGPEAARTTGVISMMSHRVFLDSDTFGALNLYARNPRAFAAVDEARGSVFATHAAVALKTAEEHDRADNLQVALESNRRIGTAIGILMGRHQWQEQEAFAALRRYSQNHNVRLVQVADEVVYQGDIPD